MTDNSRNKIRIRRVYEATLAKIESMIAQPNRVRLHMPAVWHNDQWELYVKTGLISRADVQLLASRIAVAMRLQEFMGLQPDGNWPVSSDESVKSLFNAKSMRECVSLLEAVSASELVLQTQDSFSILLGRSTMSVSDDMWRTLASRISDPLYSNNSINTKTLLHFFFTYLMSQVQSGDYWRARGLFERRVEDLDNHLRAHVRCNSMFASNIWRQLATTPVADSLRFGHIYYYDRTDENELAEVEKFYGFFADVAEELAGELSTDFARRHFAEFGLIFSDDLQLPEIALRPTKPFKTIPIASDVDRHPVPNPVYEQERIRIFLTDFRYTGDFLGDYERFWDQLAAEMRDEAWALIVDIADRFFLPDHSPERNAIIKYGEIKQSEGKVGEGEGVTLAALLEGKFDRAISYLIGRRIVLRLSHPRIQNKHLALRLGYLAREDGSSSLGGKAFGAYRRHCGLSMDDCQKPYRTGSSVHQVQGEKEWLMKYRPPLNESE
jgi:hypothetical protein